MASAPVILVAIDKSEQSEYAFKFYLDTLYQTNHKIILVHIAELPATAYEASQMYLSRGELLQLWEKEEEHGRQLFTKYKEIASQKGVTVAKGVVNKGLKPGPVISETAKEEQATAVVMGTRGLGKIRRTILGSVSDYVLHHAHCPVIICRK